MSEHKSNKQQSANLEISDLDFIRSTSAAMLEETPKRSRFLLYLIVIMLCSIVYWADNAPLDEITRGEGKVIPSHQIQIVQNLEGGIVSEILIREGDQVDKGQILLKIDDTNFESSFMESRLRYLELIVKASRLTAEAEGQERFTVPIPVIKEAPKLAANEKALFLSHKRKLSSNLDILKNQVEQKKQEVTEADSKLQQIKRSYSLAIKELNIIRPLFEAGAMSEVDVIKRERQVNELKGDLDAVRLSIPRIESTIRESENKIKELKIRYRSDAREELNEVAAEIPRILESIDTLEDKVHRTHVRSPVKGTIQKLLINTINGVVQPGMDLVKIIPTDDALIIETKIKPSDIAYLYPGLKALVKFTAYDFAIYGGLEAKVIHISADSITSEKDETFYLVRVETLKNYLGKTIGSLPIIPGMVTQVDILTGKKTVMDFLLKPILKTKENALTER
ncbi:MAG: HlyD family type I secretion periplasmic adaptor subunit [gamma proteobacterium symbiont of Taylorina sp.]|nr:HlyD family type I secretion periplasmic adaptor subunit [gamma proteobacterium symbiont of Taylorina sp.]